MQRAWILLLLLGIPLAGCAQRAGAPAAELAPRIAVELAPAPAAVDDPASAAGAGDAVADFADLFARIRSGFALPAAEHDAVRREIARYRAHPLSLERIFGRGRRYLHHIVEELDARGLPHELALLPAVESAFDPFALSRRLAAGLWQFLPGTGRSYDLAQDWWTDGRRDVREATRAALDHLSSLHEAFDGDWLLALAAYNAGPTRVRRAIARNERRGDPTDFFALELPAETRRYVPRLLALARIVAEPLELGVTLPEIPNEPYFAPVGVAHQIDLDRIADLAEIPRKELRALNPEYRRFATGPDGPRELLVPAADRERFEQLVAELPPSQRLRLVHHRVERGDTLYAIARRNGIPLEMLRRVNRIRGSRIRIGQDLLVPLPTDAEPKLARRDEA
jgi:membrane-bound lytic murein transglycosylase D